MTKIQALVVSAAMAIGMATPASAATTDPEVIIYRFPGVRDDGSGQLAGVATVFHCTNFSGVTENIRFVTRDGSSVIAGNSLQVINHLNTIVVVTHPVAAYGGVTITSGGINSGTTAIAATSINIICTAETISASNTVPTGVARRGIRFSPVPGSQE